MSTISSTTTVLVLVEQVLLQDVMGEVTMQHTNDEYHHTNTKAANNPNVEEEYLLELVQWASVT